MAGGQGENHSHGEGAEQGDGHHGGHGGGHGEHHKEPLSPEYELLLKKYQEPEVRQMDAYERLHKYHEVPGPIILYDAGKPLANLLFMHGTALRLVLIRVDFWVLFILHISISLFYFLGFKHTTIGAGSGAVPDLPWWPKIPTALIATTGGLVIFILVFYVNQTYFRYAKQYSGCMHTRGLISEVIVALRVHFGDRLFAGATEVRRTLWRFLNALHMVGYSCLPTAREDGLDIWAWAYLEDKQILTKHQMEKLQEFPPGPAAYEELLAWVDYCIWAQVSQGHLSSKAGAYFTERLWKIKASIETFYSYTTCPIPYAYFHLLNFVLLCYLLCLCYTLVFAAPFLSIPAYFIILVALLGLRELGNSMSNPFGHDELDLPVLDLVNTLYEESSSMIDMSVEFEGEPKWMMFDEGSAQAIFNLSEDL
eukprot:TRINITY_DN6949_c0_g1_i1.p1 TRINITY_DN6949_c0_g1~~TRINITY_DN6949_c0_g1_i1.p1  ORF type:complete len:423 (+),score=84.04 TRINITY_DN6949_c0_g1_i1:120-1388(+)